MFTKYFLYYLALIFQIFLPHKLSSNDKLAVTYASFDSNGFDNYRKVLGQYKSFGFERISLVPTYHHEHFNQIIYQHTPSIDTIKACLRYLISSKIKVIYKPHIDPVRYMPNYDIFSSENSSWRVNVTWRGFFDFDPIASNYYEIVVLPVLRALKDIYEDLYKIVQYPAVRFELGAELMNSLIRYGDKWGEVTKLARKFINENHLDDFIRLSHNFSHHIQIEEDYVLRMRPVEKEWLRELIKSLDEISISQYMDLSIFTPRKVISDESLADSVAKAILFYHQRFRKLILKEYLQLENWSSIPVHIGEFGIGVGGLKHPNYWEGREIDKKGQEIGFLGFLKALDNFKKIPGEKGLNATIWTIGPAYDIFGLFYPSSLNESVVKFIKEYLRN